MNTVKSHTNTAVFSLTANSPNTHVSPSSGSRMTDAFTTVLQHQRNTLHMIEHIVFRYVERDACSKTTMLECSKQVDQPANVHYSEHSKQQQTNMLLCSATQFVTTDKLSIYMYIHVRYIEFLTNIQYTMES